MFKNFIQIAGIIDKAEAEMLIKNGIKFLGFPFALPVHKEDLSRKEASAIIRNFPTGVYGVLITYLEKANEITALSKELGTTLIQIHGNISEKELKKLRELQPETPLIKSLVVSKNNFEELKENVRKFSPFVDAFITDTYDPATGASGATGKTHDWEISRSLRELSPLPLILAGGLNPENVKEAIEFVRPAGVDSHTGVENESGRKDELLVRKFISEANAAFGKI